MTQHLMKPIADLTWYLVLCDLHVLREIAPQLELIGANMVHLRSRELKLNFLYPLPEK